MIKVTKESFYKTIMTARARRHGPGGRILLVVRPDGGAR